jgi:hypothetical protein
LLGPSRRSLPLLPTRVQLVTVEDDVRLAGVERQIGSRQPAKATPLRFSALIRRARTWSVVNSRQRPPPASVHLGLVNAGFQPTLAFSLGAPDGFAEFLCGHSRSGSYNAQFCDGRVLSMSDALHSICIPYFETIREEPGNSIVFDTPESTPAGYKSLIFRLSCNFRSWTSRV